MSLSDDFIATMRAEFPRFRIIDKADNRFSRLIDWLLKVVTLGAQRDYLTHYHTVIGDTLYVPSSWRYTPDLERVVVLRHERVHLRQRRRYGTPLFTFLYLIPFFPLGLAWGRARLEWEAYTETIRATAELFGVEEATSGHLKRHIVDRFTGGDYGWMWPFRRQVERWYDDVIAELSHPAATGGAWEPS